LYSVRYINWAGDYGDRKESQIVAPSVENFPTTPLVLPHNKYWYVVDILMPLLQSTIVCSVIKVDDTIGQSMLGTAPETYACIICGATSNMSTKSSRKSSHEFLYCLSYIIPLLHNLHNIKESTSEWIDLSERSTRTSPARGGSRFFVWLRRCWIVFLCSSQM